MKQNKAKSLPLQMSSIHGIAVESIQRMHVTFEIWMKFEQKYKCIEKVWQRSQ